jgi:extracellular elastinolytic metalloproteinase
MRFLTAATAAAILAHQAVAHPAHHHAGASNGLQNRAVDLNAFRLTTSAAYSNVTSTTKSEVAKISKRATYVETATEAVKKVAPKTEFRVVGDHYVSSNGIAHVNFKQTVHGIDIDNADFNVNVSSIMSSGYQLSYTRKMFFQIPRAFQLLAFLVLIII